MSTLFLADTSAFTAALKSSFRERRLRALAADGVLATFVTVDLELGYSARSPSEHVGIVRSRAQLLQFAFVDAIAQRAREVQALMAMHSQNRAAGVIDLLTAAAAEHYGASVLHFDADFDHIAAVTGQSTTWVTPRSAGT